MEGLKREATENPPLLILSLSRGVFNNKTILTLTKYSENMKQEEIIGNGSQTERSELTKRRQAKSRQSNNRPGDKGAPLIATNITTNITYFIIHAEKIRERR